MPRAIPILVIVGLAVYSFFDVLQNRSEDIRKFSRTTWLVLVLIPIVGAALWFIIGRPRYGRGGYSPPRIITLRSPQRPKAPDDDPAFLRRLEEEAWLRKRDEARRRAAEGKADETPRQGESESGGESQPPREGPAPGGPGIAPA